MPKKYLMGLLRKLLSGKKDELLKNANFFNIPVDGERLGDYIVKKSTPTIEIIDKKNNISYNSTYITYFDDVNCFIAQMNCVTSISQSRKEENIYYIGSETPIITRTTFVDGDCQLVFEGKKANSDCAFTDNGVNMKVKYLQKVVYDENISSELNNFDAEIGIKKGMLQEEFDLIFSKLFRNKSFDEICSLVSANKDFYFSLIREQLEIAAYVNNFLEKGKSKVKK